MESDEVTEIIELIEEKRYFYNNTIFVLSVRELKHEKKDMIDCWNG
jgi:hypothetical protein